MKILIIGGSGRISYKTACSFIKQGEEVTVINRGNHDLPFIHRSLIVGDINDEKRMRPFFKSRFFDVVIDFVAFTPSDIALHLSYFANHPHYIFVSSTVATNRRLTLPPYDESTPLGNPESQYGQNKASSERYLNQSDYPFFTIVRPSQTFDERAFPVLIHGKGTYSIIARMKTGKAIPLFDGGTSEWALLYANDFAKGIKGILLNEKANKETYQITGSENHTWKEIFLLEGEALGCSPLFFNLDSRKFIENHPSFHDSLVGDKFINSTFKQGKINAISPSFERKTPLLDAFKITNEYISSHPEAQIEDPSFDAFLDSLMAS